MPRSRPTPAIGPRCHDLRIKDIDNDWRIICRVREFLGLTEVEAATVELRLALSRVLKERRTRRRLSQGQLARLLGSSQSRVAKMEAGDPSVSIDSRRDS